MCLLSIKSEKLLSHPYEIQSSYKVLKYSNKCSEYPNQRANKQNE